jgi:AcrR family transcriptional regulator
MVQLAKEFDVAPGLIHYYIGNRDNLISGVLNSYYKGRLRRLPKLTGAWRADIEAMAHVMVKYNVEYAGVAQYIASHNRFRLFQQVDKDEVDYGVVFFDHVAQAFLQGGFTPAQVGLAFHLLMQFIVASCMSLVSRQLPADHEKFIRAQFNALSEEEYPAAKLVGDKFASLDFAQAFGSGLALLLDGFEGWLAKRDRAGSPARKLRKL